MSRRKDNKGRVLRTGESQRKDLIYQYRYTDALGNRKCIYASDLKTLREKEDELQRSLEDGLDYAGGEITVYELLQRYLSLKCGVRYNTKVGYGFVMNIVQKEPFGARKIRDIKVSDAQRWMIKLQKEGKGYSTLTSIRGVVKPAFQMAYNEEVVRRNPFDFKLTDVVANDSQKRISLTEKQQKVWMNFIREDKSYAKYYDEFVVLLQDIAQPEVDKALGELERSIGRRNLTRSFPLSVAVGYAMGQDDPIEQMFRQADADMYQNKTRMKCETVTMDRA